MHYVNERQDNWHKLLPMLEFADNNSYQASIDTRPFCLGKHLRTLADLHLPSDVPAAEECVVKLRDALVKAKASLQAVQQCYKAYAGKGTPDAEFTAAEKVLLNPHSVALKGVGTRKLHAKFIGPNTVTCKIGPVAYELDLHVNIKIRNVFHTGLLKKWKSDGNYQPAPPPETVDGEERWVI